VAQYDFFELERENVHNMMRDYITGKDEKNFLIMLARCDVNATYESEDYNTLDDLKPLHGFLHLGRKYYCERTKDKFKQGLDALLAAEADVNLLDGFGQTAIFNLFYLFSDDLYLLFSYIDKFVAAGAKVNITDIRENSLLLKILTEIHRCVRQRADRSVADSWAIEVVKYLLKTTDLDLNFTNMRGETVLSRYYIDPQIADLPKRLTTGYSNRLLAFLEAEGLKFEKKDKWSLSPLEREIKRNNLREFLRLCVVGVKIPADMDESFLDLMFRAAENILKQK